MSKKAVITAVAISIAGGLLVWQFRLKPMRSATCATLSTYEVESVERQDTGTAGLSAELSIRARLEWVPVATSTGSTLFRVTVRSPQFSGYPDGVATLGPSIESISTFVEVSRPKPFLLWREKANHPIVASNLVKHLINPLSFQRASGVVVENDGLGEGPVSYEADGDRVTKVRTAYVNMSSSSPLPTITAAKTTFAWKRELLPHRANSLLHFTQVWDPARSAATFSRETKYVLAAATARTPAEQSECEATSPEQWTAARNLMAVSPAFEFEVPAKAAAVTKSTKELLVEVERQSDPIRTLEELTSRLEQNPQEADQVRKALEKLKHREDRSAFLISALANAEVPEAQAALRQLIDFYLLAKKDRLAIRTMRAQQLSDYVDKDTVENLVRLSEDRGQPPKIRQSALLAAGSSATVLGDEGLRNHLRERWEEKAAGSTVAKEKAELLSALGNLASADSVGFLEKIIRSDQGYVGDQAIDALRLVRTTETEKLLVEVASQDPAPNRRRAALTALEFRPFSEGGCNELAARYKALLQQHGTSSEAERMHLLSALGQQGHRDYPAVKQFLTALGNDSRLTKKEKEYLTQLKTTGF